MTQIWLYSLASVFVVSLISLIGSVALAVKEEKLRNWLLYIVSFSAGALLGDVFLHILPEMAEQGFGPLKGFYILVGILLFFVLERFILWQHTHGQHTEEVHSMVYLTIFGDSLHNFIDGLIIAAAFIADITVGIAVTLAVIFHEIPQEIGNFAVLIHGGWSKTKALWYNFLSALAAVLGAVVALVFTKFAENLPAFLLSLGAASFIYIALSDIIPQLHLEKNSRKSGVQLVWFLAGIGVMSLLLLLE